MYRNKLKGLEGTMDELFK